MTDGGIKQGSGDDIWAEEDSDGSDSETATDGDRGSTTPEREPRERSSTAREREPVGDENYLDRRDGAKDERRLVQFFLRDEVYSEMTEDRLRADVGEKLGESPGRFDLREAMVEIAQNHPDEVASALERMGY